jgi:hypothetical protein
MTYVTPKMAKEMDKRHFVDGDSFERIGRETGGLHRNTVYRCIMKFRDGKYHGK